jgi:hypothetical protein
MMPYHAYQLHQTERAKSAAEIRRADLQLRRMAATVSRPLRSRRVAAGAFLPIRGPRLTGDRIQDPARPA